VVVIGVEHVLEFELSPLPPPLSHAAAQFRFASVGCLEILDIKTKRVCD